MSIVPLILPNPGNIYKYKLKIPLIGIQIIETEIITDKFANIRLSGLINENAYGKLIIKNGEYSIKFSNNLQKKIYKYNTELINPSYNIKKDEIRFILNIKSISYKSNIYMYRIN